ncbi:MAG: hypothetical protein AAB358_00065 [Patescibacteria group bacterium]
MAKFPVKISKLVLEFNQESAAGAAFIAGEEGQKEMRSRLGAVFGLIEFFGLAEETREKLFEIIADFETEYYLPPFDLEGGLEKRFEECLGRANRRIYKVIKDSPVKIELRNINLLVGLIYHNQIYLSQIGKINAFLFHERRRHDHAIIDIMGQAGERKQKIDPEKMFSNIISGAITNRDNLFFCNDSVLEYLSQNNLLEIVTERTALAAIQQIEQILAAQSRADNFYAILVQPETVPGESIKKTAVPLTGEYRREEIPTQYSIDKLVVTQKKTESFLMPSMMPNWKKLLILLGRGVKKTLQFLAKQSKILIIKTARQSKRMFIAAISGFKSSGANPPSPKLRPIKEKIETVKFKENKPSKKPPMENEDLEDEFKTESNQNLSAPEDAGLAEEIFSDNKNLKISEKVSDCLNRQIAKFVSLRRSRQIMIVALLILIFGFSQSIVWRGQNGGSSDSKIQGIISQINEKINTAEAQNVFNDEAGAKLSIEEAKTLLGQIPDTRKYRQTRQDLQNKINDLVGAIQKLTYLENLTVVADLSGQNQMAASSGLAKAGNFLAVFDNQNQTLYRVDLEKKQVLPTKLGLENINKIVSQDDKNVILLNGTNNFYRYNLTGTASPVLVLKNSGPVTDFEIYGNNLYTLEPDKNQIYKHSPTGSGFNSGAAWLKSDASAQGGKAIAVDAGIYLIKDSGEINYFISGRAQATSFPALEPALKPIQAFTNADSGYLYLLDKENKRIVVYDKNGNLKTQITAKDFGDLKAMTVVEKEKKIYLLSDNKVLEVPINF